MRIPVVFTLLSLVPILSACGGGGAGAGGLNTTIPPVGVATYSDLTAQAQTITDLWLATSFTDPATLPVSGTAVFDGAVLLVGDVNGVDTNLAGTLSLSADFFGSGISGDVTGISDSTDQLYTGNLAISGGAIDRGADTATGYTFAADLDGVLTGAGTSMTINGLMNGDFKGVGYLATTGPIAGTVTSGGHVGALYGAFAAEQ